MIIFYNLIAVPLKFIININISVYIVDFMLDVVFYIDLFFHVNEFYANQKGILVSDKACLRATFLSHRFSIYYIGYIPFDLVALIFYSF